jgi:hypothetical protein
MDVRPPTDERELQVWSLFAAACLKGIRSVTEYQAAGYAIQAARIADRMLAQWRTRDPKAPLPTSGGYHLSHAEAARRALLHAARVCEEEAYGVATTLREVAEDLDSCRRIAVTARPEEG